MKLPRNTEFWPHLVLFLAAFAWGTTFSLVKRSLDFTTPFLFMSLRFGLATLLMAVLAHRSLRRIDRRALFGGVLTGLTLFLGFSFQTWGLVFTSASKSAFITGLNVVLVPFLLRGLGHRRIRIKSWVAAVVAAFGLYLLTDPSVAGFNLGDILTLVCAVAFAGQIILLGIYSPTVNTVSYFRVQVVTVTVLSLLAVLLRLEGPVHLHLSAPLLWGIGITGVFGTFLAFLGMTWAQRRTSPTRTALILTSEPVFGALFAVLIAGEFLSLQAWLGGAVIIGSIVWAEVSG